MPRRRIDSHPRRPYSYIQGTRSAATRADHTHLEIDITDLQNYSVVGHTHVKSDITDFAYGLFRRDGFVALPARETLHLIGGTGITITASDDAGNDETDITINSVAISLDDLSDVNLAGTSDGFVLSFDSVSGKWIDTTPAAAGLSEVGHVHVKADITDFAHTHVKADITDFAHTHVEADITDLQAYLLNITGEAIENLSNVIVGIPAAKHWLRFNSVNSKWENQSLATLVVDLNIQGGIDADLLQGEAASAFADAVHTHVKADITDFAHTHVEADITDLQAYLVNITGESIGSLSDVLLGSPQSKHWLRFNTANSKWENQSLATLVADLNIQGGIDADQLGGFAESAFAKLADNETITKTWTFNTITVLDGGFRINAPSITTHVIETIWDGSRNRWIIVPKPSGIADFSKELFYNFSAGFWGIENVQLNTAVGWFGATPSTKKTVTGSRGGNAALASLLTQLANYGVITDSTTA